MFVELDMKSEELVLMFGVELVELENQPWPNDLAGGMLPWYAYC